MPVAEDWVLLDVNPDRVAFGGMVSGVGVTEEEDEGGGMPGPPVPGLDELDVAKVGVLEANDCREPADMLGCPVPKGGPSLAPFLAFGSMDFPHTCRECTLACSQTCGQVW